MTATLGGRGPPAADATEPCMCRGQSSTLAEHLPCFSPTLGCRVVSGTLPLPPLPDSGVRARARGREGNWIDRQLTVLPVRTVAPPQTVVAVRAAPSAHLVQPGRAARGPDAVLYAPWQFSRWSSGREGWESPPSRSTWRLRLTRFSLTWNRGVVRRPGGQGLTPPRCGRHRGQRRFSKRCGRGVHHALAVGEQGVLPWSHLTNSSSPSSTAHRPRRPRGPGRPKGSQP